MELYFCDSLKVPDEQFKYYESLLPKELLNVLDGSRRDMLRRSAVCAEGMVRSALSEAINIPPQKIEFYRGQHGKPYIAENIHFNISHSENYAVAAVSENEIGVDVEKIRQPKMRTAEKFCTEREKALVTDAISFFRLWTLKEAYLKCIGDGIYGGLKSVEFSALEGEIISSAPDFRFEFSERDRGCVIALCEKIKG
ncbi:MAG: 4'-phosphopantetheinyl transferase superfamily protein [Clostridiales bacterium]|nr:4'-phosphopantetheinyl transferase superfamily protein [Clostridiales bacterium]